ncbi:MAG: hypothetical protein KBC96_04665 [Armatimonadetes bacterium]|nr:hypothetical protein [Armatimonadota bacterium]
MRRLPLFLFAVGAVLLPGSAWCNPVPAGPLDLLPAITVFNYTIDLFFIILALLIIRPADKVPLWKVLKIAFLAMIAGLCADAIGALAAGWVAYSGTIRAAVGGLTAYETDLIGFVGMVAFPVPLILVANYVLGRIGFRMTRREALWYGLIIGLATAPITSAELTWAVYSDAGARLMATALLVFGLGDLILLLVLRKGRRAGLPVKLTTFACALVLVGISIPIRVHQVRTEIEYLPEQACHSQLMAIRRALDNYGRDNPDELPARLGLLVPKYVPKPDLLRCPVHKRGEDGSAYIYSPPEGESLLSEIMSVHCPAHGHEFHVSGAVKQNGR